MTDEHKKKLGAFYTPQEVTDTLSVWAVRSSNDTIVEPSFGGCNFLVSSVKTLKSFGNEQPSKNIYGFDIDSNAFEFLKQNNFDSTNFYHQDFLAFETLKPSFADVILGNPPYLPVHKLDINYKKFLIEAYANSGYTLSKKSSLWVYFIIKALTYLKPGGRMAWVVPDSIAFTIYGKSLLQQLRTQFGALSLIRINERYFSESGTKEKTSFLLGEDYLCGTSEIIENQFEHLADALSFLKKGDKIHIKEKDKLNNSLDNLTNINFDIHTIGDLFKIRIGIVLGATNLLTFSEEEIKSTEYYPHYCYPIITKGKQLKNISISTKELTSDSKTSIYLIDALKLESENPQLFSEFLSTIPETVLVNQTFRNRSRLFGYDDFSHPEAFLTFYSQGLPKFIINHEKELNCTNSVHRLYIKSPIVSQTVLKYIAMQFFCEFFRREIKSIGRQYGNAIIKYEPSDAAKIPVLVPKKMSTEFQLRIEEMFFLVKQSVHSGNIESAKDSVYHFIENALATHHNKSLL